MAAGPEVGDDAYATAAYDADEPTGDAAAWEPIEATSASSAVRGSGVATEPGGERVAVADDDPAPVGCEVEGPPPVGMLVVVDTPAEGDVEATVGEGLPGGDADPRARPEACEPEQALSMAASRATARDTNPHLEPIVRSISARRGFLHATWIEPRQIDGPIRVTVTTLSCGVFRYLLGGHTRAVEC